MLFTSPFVGAIYICFSLKILWLYFVIRAESDKTFTGSKSKLHSLTVAKEVTIFDHRSQTQAQEEL